MAARSDNSYFFGEFRFDPSTLVLYRGTERIDLTPKSAEILAELLSNAGSVVMKEELMKRAWPDSFVEEANLSHHIFKLRQVLGESDDRKLIETVPKRGYRFVGTLSSNFPDTSETASDAIARPAATHWLMIVVPIGTLAIIAAVIWFAFLRPSESVNPSTATKSFRTIAVLPFINESGNDEIEYLADGMTETLIASLTKVKTLGVKPRASVFRYKGKDVSAISIGSELGVESALFGRLTKRGETVTLFLSLVDTRTDYQIWGKQYVRGMSELAAFQSEIGREVAKHLEAELSGADELLLSRNYSENAEAYRLYLLGNYYWGRFTEENFRKAIDQFQKAIAIDPDYALAHVGLSNSYSVLGVNGHISVAEARDRSRAACDRALQLDSGLAEAHLCDGAYKLFYEWNLAGAEAAFKRAMELDPSYLFPYELNAYVLRSQQRFDEAIAEIKKARELDPLNLLLISDLSTCYRFAGRLDDAIATYDQLLEMDPTFADGYFEKALAHSERGDHETAVKLAKRAIELSGGSTKVIAGLGIAHARAGDRAKAERIIEELKTQPKEKYVSPQDIALIYSALGDRDNAFAWLEKAYAARSCWLIELNVDPAFRQLRDDPRFADLARRVGLSAQ
jgi:TolB-like protein/DNA-binding winged helix-turn-helix (wHTH) protein/Flp pilus assembly protein TadD